jgi:hypothetical protein
MSSLELSDLCEIPQKLKCEAEVFPYKKCIISECFQFKPTKPIKNSITSVVLSKNPIGFKNFDFIMQIGKGSFGKVFLVIVLKKVRYKETG